jgi:hypothetical protein
MFHIDRRNTLNPKNSYASPTPIVEGDRVYVHFGADDTAALITTGEIVCGPSRTGRRATKPRPTECRSVGEEKANVGEIRSRSGERLRSLGGRQGSIDQCRADRTVFERIGPLRTRRCPFMNCRAARPATGAKASQPTRWGHYSGSSRHKSSKFRSPSGHGTGMRRLVSSKHARSLSLRLRAALVTLSACDTGAGGLYGQEGVSSLVRPFLAAGARTVVANLWSADDTFSLAIMREFYRQLAAGADKGGFESRLPDHSTPRNAQPCVIGPRIRVSRVGSLRELGRRAH